MDSQNIMFTVLAVLIVLASFATVLTKNVIRAATYLLLVLLGTAGLYFLLGYTFLGSVQIMVYAGGIVVLYVFSILLTSGAKETLSRNSRIKTAAAAVLSIAGFAAVLFVIFQQKFIIEAAVLGAPVESVEGGTSIAEIGRQMLSTEKGGYLLPFEAVSVLLLACIVGGLLIARKR